MGCECGGQCGGTEVRVVLSDALVVGPEDILVVKVSGKGISFDAMDVFRETLDEALGGDGRSFVIYVDERDAEVELTKVESWPDDYKGFGSNVRPRKS